MPDLFSQKNLIGERRFNFEDFTHLREIWEGYELRGNTDKIHLLVSDNSATLGYWLVPFNFKEAKEFDKLFKGNEIRDLIHRVSFELNLNNKTKRMFLIKSDSYDGAIVATCGLVTGYTDCFKELFGQTLNQIKPFLKQQKNLNVSEIEVYHKSDLKHTLFDR